MTTKPSAIQQRLAELREQLSKLESLRALLGDELTDQKAAELEARIRSLVDTGGGAFVAGSVDLRRGDFVGRDKWQLWVDKLYLGHATDQVPQDALLQAYLRSLAAECGRLPLGVVDPRFLQTGAETPVQLDQIYIGLDVLAPAREEREKGEGAFLKHLARGEGGERTPLLEAIAAPESSRFVVLGDPGSGKTTVVHYLAFALAGAATGSSPAQRLPEGSPLLGMLPVRLVLREVVARCIPLDAQKGEAGMLWAALRADLATRLGDGAAGRLLPYLQDRLLEQGGLVMLDGLDEVPEANHRRRCLLEAAAGLAATLPAGRSRVLVTARPYAYADPRWRLPGFQTLVLAPFDEGQVSRFLARWYQAVGPVMGWDEATAQGRGERLGEALEERPYLADLASRPLLLTLMATLHTSWGQLPEDRADLYEETVKLLLSRWQRAREVRRPDGEIETEPGIARVLAVEEEPVRTALHRLAFRAHEQQGAVAGREEGPADIDGGAVLAAFAPLLPEDFNPQMLLDYLETRAGLLVSRAPGSYAFPHRSFQEYLAACCLADGQDFAGELCRRVRDDLDWWRAVFLLGVGKARQGGLSNAVHVVNTLVPEGPEEATRPVDAQWQSAVLAGQALLDLRFPEVAQGQPHFQAVLKRVRRWLVALLQTPDALAPRERAEAGDVLGRLGDPRPGVGVIDGPAGRPPIPDLLWCEVPAGTFLMGSGAEDKQAYDDEKPQHAVDLPAFLIGRFPITNAQYRPFVEDGGYDEARYWTPDGWAWRTGGREPDLSPLNDVGDEEWKGRYAEWLAQRTLSRRDRPFWWGHPRWGLANRPVVGVNWYEALAYCAWLGERLQEAEPPWQVWRDGRLAEQKAPSSGFWVGLPTEAEWEKAARGSRRGRKARARPWPWGDEWLAGRANTEEAGIGETSAAGCFPAGASPCGVLDLAGNVWEWTSTCWGRASFNRPDYTYPYDAADGREEPDGPDLRVVRGGSWLYAQRNARCAARDGDLPDGCNLNLGFRVVMSLASSEF
jgi:formylglycine-generating enzyme required for sulfatase activity